MGDASNQYIGLIPERQFGAARRKSELRTGSSGLNYGSKNGLRWAAANTPANVDSTRLGASRHIGEVLIIASNGLDRISENLSLSTWSDQRPGEPGGRADRTAERNHS